MIFLISADFPPLIFSRSEARPISFPLGSRILTALPNLKFPFDPITPAGRRLLPFSNTAFLAPSSIVISPVGLRVWAIQCLRFFILFLPDENKVPTTFPLKTSSSAFPRRPLMIRVGIPELMVFR
jgi:hypothetical protein